MTFQLKSAIKNMAGHAITSHAPTLIKFLARPDIRTRFQCKAHSCFIDIHEINTLRSIRISRTNAVYLLDMMNSFDYYFDSARSIPTKAAGQTRHVVDFSTPRFQAISGFDDFPIMSSSLTEPFITSQQYLDFAQLKEGDVVFDLGSYSSLTSIAFSKAVGSTGKVIALEPDPTNHSCCKINIEQHARSNNLSNIQLINAAVSDTNSTLRFSSEGSMGSSAANLVGSYRGTLIDVPCLTLEDIARQSQSKKVDFIKMDIEGSELAALESSTIFFEKFRPRMIIEPHIVNGALSDAPIMAFLSKLGYECLIIEQIGVQLPLVTAVPQPLQ